jgi:hypothetical protein
MKVYYINVGSPEYEMVSGKIQETYPNACIVWIEKVEESKYQYNQRKELIECLRGDVQEKLLFHGTDEKNINDILKHGFSMDKCKVCADTKIPTNWIC